MSEAIRRAGRCIATSKSSLIVPGRRPRRGAVPASFAAPLTYTRRVPVRFRARAGAARAPRRRHRLKLLLLLLVPAVLAANGIPTPESVFGFKPGADYKLATYDQSVDYFRRLDAVSKNVRLVQAGATTQGRP